LCDWLISGHNTLAILVHFIKFYFLSMTDVNLYSYFEHQSLKAFNGV